MIEPNALWLADELESQTYDFKWHSTAADELRRLHKSNEKLLRMLHLAGAFISQNRPEDDDWNLHKNIAKTLKEEGWK
jgi:mRNA-degrading endonuclease RelE of RelBE toxin-antitoxin system